MNIGLNASVGYTLMVNIIIRPKDLYYLILFNPETPFKDKNEQSLENFYLWMFRL
jgi:hypothetical protein